MAAKRKPYEVSFDATPADKALIAQIVLRAKRSVLILRGHGTSTQLRSSLLDPGNSSLDLTMDLRATHANGNPLRLADMLSADDFNFGHDICGIQRHLNRDTGKLENHFRPRFSQRAA